MNKYQLLATRYYKFFKYLRIVGLVSFILFLVVTAFNRGYQILSIISYFALLIAFSCLIECVILYVLHIILKNKG